MLCESAIHAYASSNLVSSKATARKVATPSFTMDKSKHTHTYTHALTHTRHAPLVDFFPPVRGRFSQQSVLLCFPDICSTFPFGVAGKGSGMEKGLQPPTAATRLWEESSRSGARRPQSGIFVVSFLLCRLRSCTLWSLGTPSTGSPCLSCSPSPPTKKSQKQAGEIDSLCTYLPAPPLPEPPFPDYLYWWGAHMKRDHPFLQERGRSIWPHQQSGSPLAVTLWPG